MLRPRRAAAKRSKKPEKEIEIDESEANGLDLSEESDGDFSSGSIEDDWNPSKTQGEETIDETFETESESSDGEDEEDNSESAADSPVKTSKSRGNRSLIASLRGTPQNRFKSKQQQRNSLGGSSNLQEILQRSQFQKKKSIFDEIQDEEAPDFDCSGGLRLSESDGSDDEPCTSAKVVQKEKKKKTSALTECNDQVSSGTVMEELVKNLEQEENIRTKLMNYENNKELASNQKENVNIADLLAAGEKEAASSSLKKASQKRASHTQADSDSDGWEEVEDEEAPAYKVPNQGVEIMLNNFNQQQKKESKPVDLEAQMKRKLNRRRKEYQMHLHRVNLVCWVTHGNFVNRALNNSSLMAVALDLLPKNDNHCYPKEQTDLDYFTQITKFFKKTIKLNNQNMYCEMRTRPPLKTSLALQMKFKVAICRRDYVLIFITLLRAIGIQCRMVQSLVCAPIFPPKSDRMSLSTKKPNEKGKSSSSKSKNSESSSRSKPSSRSSKSKSTSSSESKSTSSSKNKSNSSKHSSNSNTGSSKSPEKSSRSSRSRSKKSSEKLAIPQLDGGDDLPGSSRAKRGLKIKLPTVSEKSTDRKDENVAPGNSDEVVVPKRKSILIVRPDTPRSSRSGTRSPAVTKMHPRVSFSMDSPNRNSPTSSEKFNMKTKNAKRLAPTSDVFSPRKTRKKTLEQAATKSYGNQLEREQIGSTANKVTKSQAPKDVPGTSKASKVQSEASPMDTLKVFSPRRLRSRSRSAEEEAKPPNKVDFSMKPNLKNLQKSQDRKRPTSTKDEIESKKAKPEPRAEKRKSSNNEDKEVIPKKASRQQPKENLDNESNDITKFFKPSPALKKKETGAKLNDTIDRRVLSTDEDEPIIESPTKKSKSIDIWVEVYSEKDARWIAIDVFKNKIDCVTEIVKTARSPVVYAFAWNNDNSLKDVSARYCPNLNTTVRKMRVDNKYLSSVIGKYEGIKTDRDIREDDELNKLQLQKPMPKTISEFKNHPLYALTRHLLKYEAIYPPEPPILGYIREEAIYPRDCVYVLHTRETWLKEARVVKLNELPYKNTKTLKWDNVNRKMIKDVPQELFGPWQTKDYEPPVAENGMVPRNAYGNVELFKPCMLPIGTVHLQLPGLNKVCKKLGIDCSQAIVGFDSNGGWPYPVYDGFIVCAEFEEKVLDAWNREQEEQEKKEQEKYEKRVYGNWKKLIKGLFIQKRLKNRYNFEGEPPT